MHSLPLASLVEQNISPKFIWYSDKPDGPCALLSLQDFESRYKTASLNLAFKFTENIFYNTPLYHKVARTDYALRIAENFNANVKDLYGISLKAIVFNEFKDWLKTGYAEIMDKLVFTKIADDIGWGIFSRENIPKNTLVAFYSGILKSAKICNDYEHLIYWDPIDSQLRFSIDAYSTGGTARFFNHLPMRIDPQQAQMLFRTSLNKRFAAGNLLKYCLIYNGFPIIVFVTAVDINPGEQLGYDYGDSYRWNGKPFYFDTIGRIIQTD